MPQPAADGSDSRMSRQHSAFVGRRRELNLLQHAFQDVHAGSGRTVLITGEPGIGKSRLVEVFIAGIAPGIADVMVARCEGREQAPALWPWLQILEPILAAAHSATTPVPLRTAIEGLDRILNNPDRQEVPESGLQRMQQGETRFMLFRSVLELIWTMSASRPVVLCLDDLQWADASSLDLFVYLAANIDEIPVMLIATCRNDSVTIEGRISATIAAVARQRGHTYLQLDTLSPAEVADYLTSTLSVELHQDTLDAVFSATGGNPFFMREVGWLIESSGAAPGTVAAIKVPDTLRHTIGERLSRLPVTSRYILDAAAVVGHRFDAAVLAGTASEPAQQVIQSLQPALLAGIVDEITPDTFQFSHVLVRDAIYQNIPPVQQRTLHLSAGQCIERLASGIDPPYAVLSHHFSQAITAGAARDAVRCAVLAAQDALARYAWEAATDHCQSGLRAIRYLEDPDPATHCDLLLLLGQAQAMAGAGREKAVLAGASPDAVHTYTQAACLAEKNGLSIMLARAALGVTGLAPAVPQGGIEGIALLKRALESLPQEQKVLRAEVMARLAVDTARLWSVGSLHLDSDDVLRFREQSDEAVNLARQTDNPRTLAWALTARSVAREGSSDPNHCMQDADEVIHLGRTGSDPIILSWGLTSKYNIHLEHGQSTLADKVLDDIEDLTARADTPLMRLKVATMRSGQALRRGNFGAAEEFINRAQQIWPDTATIALQLVWLRKEQCRLPEIHDRIRARHERLPGSPLWKAIRILCSYEAGDLSVTREQWEDLFTNEYAGLPHCILWLRSLAMLAELAHVLDDRERANILYQELSPVAGQHLFIQNSDHTGGAVTMYLGLLSTTCQHWTDAERRYQQALEMNERAGNLPYVAYTLYFWADMLNQRDRLDDRARARVMSRMALQASRDMQMDRLSTMTDRLIDRLTPVPLPAQTMGLTEREIEVLELLVQGMTNREIGEALFISSRTVGSHVSNILGKLNVQTRTEAAARAVRDNLA